MSRASKSPRFVFLLNRAQKALQRWIETRPQAWDGISSAQAGLLFFLASRNQATVGDIAAALDVAPAAVTNLSKRMEAAQLVARTSDASDGRITRLHLTATGVRASAQAGAVFKELNQRLSAGFSADELATVERWLTHVHQLDSDSSG
jgi:DNA-binding MarR family transcriptional regulator